MANLWRFNSVLFNWGKAVTSAVQQDDIIFNWFWLKNTAYITSDVSFRNMPQINLLTYANPKNDWWGVLDRFYKKRTIKLEWSIISESAIDMEHKIDNLKKALSVKTWYLDFKVWENYRRILCSLTNSDIINRRGYDITHAKFSLTFEAQNPFWSEKVRSSSTFDWVNDEINENINNEWSEYSNPIINIVFSSATNVNELKVKIWNNEIVINESITSGDIIDINTIDKNVTLNATSVDFSGKFPRLESGINMLTMKCNGTYNYDVAVLYPKNYL